MKNHILALSLAAMLSLASFSAFAQVSSGGNAVITALAVAPDLTQSFGSGATSVVFTNPLSSTNIGTVIVACYLDTGATVPVTIVKANVTTTNIPVTFSSTASAGTCALNYAGGMGPAGPPGS